MIPHSRPHADAGEIAAVVQALQAGRLSQGEEVARLESDLSAIFDAAGLCPGQGATEATPRRDPAARAEVVAVSSGTAALYLALVALGARKGKKVIIPSYTCQSLYAAVAHAGATPVCADTGKGSVCITSSTIKPLMDDAVAAVIVPHMFGFAADIKGLGSLGCPVIEDCAQSAGGRYADGSLLGSIGHVAILSFYGTKLLPAGEGGACVTRNKGLAEKIRLLRNCDEVKLNPRAFNFKMGDLNAALARAKLRSLDAMNERRGRIAQLYDEAFGLFSFRVKSARSQAVCFRYLLELPSRAARGTDKGVMNFLEKAREAGITCRRPVWDPLHHTLGGKCPRAERLHNTLVSVPIYPALSKAEAEKICRSLSKILA